MAYYSMKAQKLRVLAMENGTLFYCDLEAAMDSRSRDDETYIVRISLQTEDETMHHGFSNDISLDIFRIPQTEFVNELLQQAFRLFGTCSCQVTDENWRYLERMEQDIMGCFSTRTGLIVRTGSLASLNVSVAIPKPGYTIV